MAKTPTDIMEVRRANLRALVAQWSGPTNLAKKLHLSGSSYISQLVSGERPITEKTARKFEAQLDLPTGWLDGAPHAAKPAAIDDQLLARVVMLVGTIAEEMGVKLGHDKHAELVVMAYEETLRVGALDETFVQKLVKLAR